MAWVNNMYRLLKYYIFVSFSKFSLTRKKDLYYKMSGEREDVGDGMRHRLADTWNRKYINHTMS